MTRRPGDIRTDVDETGVILFAAEDVVCWLYDWEQKIREAHLSPPDKQLAASVVEAAAESLSHLWLDAAHSEADR